MLGTYTGEEMRIIIIIIIPGIDFPFTLREIYSGIYDLWSACILRALCFPNIPVLSSGHTHPASALRFFVGCKARYHRQAQI